MVFDFSHKQLTLQPISLVPLILSVCQHSITKRDDALSSLSSIMSLLTAEDLTLPVRYRKASNWRKSEKE